MFQKMENNVGTRRSLAPDVLCLIYGYDRKEI